MCNSYVCKFMCVHTTVHPIVWVTRLGMLPLEPVLSICHSGYLGSLIRSCWTTCGERQFFIVGKILFYRVRKYVVASWCSWLLTKMAAVKNNGFKTSIACKFHQGQIEWYTVARKLLVPWHVNIDERTLISHGADSSLYPQATSHIV